MEFLLESVLLGCWEEDKDYVLLEALENWLAETGGFDDIDGSIASGDSEDHFGDSLLVLWVDETDQIGEAGDTAIKGAFGICEVVGSEYSLGSFKNCNFSFILTQVNTQPV